MVVDGMIKSGKDGDIEQWFTTLTERVRSRRCQGVESSLQSTLAERYLQQWSLSRRRGCLLLALNRQRVPFIGRPPADVDVPRSLVPRTPPFGAGAGQR